ncbi:MAG: hypothetical protein IJ433_03110 [Ruminococcus sp.]|nr:hypothetical protein [Ruminococcus sp.]
MKQKGRRFYVEEPAKKAKKTKKTANVELEKEETTFDENGVSDTNAQDESYIKSDSKKSKADFRREQRMKQQISKKLEKSRKKALKESKKPEDNFDVHEEIEQSSKVIRFKTVEEKATNDNKQSKHNINKNDNYDINESKEKKTSGKISDLLSKMQDNKKTIVLCAVILLVLLISVFVFSNRDRLSFSSVKNWVEYGVLNKESEQSFPVATNGDVINNGNFSRVQRDLVYASDTRFAILNNYGRTVYENSQAYLRPVLTRAADGDLSLVYNLGSTGYSIYNLDSTIFSGEAEDNIVVADISKSGAYALVTEKDGYLSKLYVYKKDNSEKPYYAYSFADYYITSVSLDDKGNTALLTGISAHEGKQISCVYVLDFTKEEPLVFEEFEDNIFYYADHLSNNNVCIIGESATFNFNMFTKKFSKTPYDGKTLTAFDVNTDTNNYALSLSRSADGRKCDILVFSTQGKLKNTISTELKITSLSTYKNRVAALSDNKVYLYSKEGKEISQIDAGLSPNAVVLYSTNDAYILGVSEIRRLDL